MLSLGGKIVMFKRLYLIFFDYCSKLIDRITSKNPKKTFIWHYSHPKINHKTLCNNFENGGVKYVDISSKIISLPCSWFRKLFDEIVHEWNVISPQLINKSCFSFDWKLLMKFSKFSINPWFQWSSCLFVSSELCSCILSDFLWFNKHVLIEKKSTYR